MISDSACSTELSMPRHADLGRVRRSLGRLSPAVGLVGLTDNHVGLPRLSPLAAVAACLEHEMRPIVHISCRDRNRLGVQQQVMGAAALGAAGVLVVWGDGGPSRHPEAPSVVDVLRELPGWAAPFTLLRGAVVNPFRNRRREMDLVRRKLEAGVDFLQTQMVFDLPAFDDFLADLAGVAPSELPIFASVGVIRSQRALDFIRSVVPTCPIPESVAVRIAEGRGAEVAREVATELGARPGLRLHVIPLGAEGEVEGVCSAYIEARGRLLRVAG